MVVVEGGGCCKHSAQPPSPDSNSPIQRHETLAEAPPSRGRHARYDRPRPRHLPRSKYLQTSGKAPSLGYYPAGTRTGNAQFDPIIAALEQSADLPQALIGWQQIACKVPPIQGLGGPPACPPGVADGTRLDAISGAACEGYWRLRPAGDAAVRLAVGPTQRLYAIVRHDSSQGYPPGQYALIYANPAQPEFGSAVYVSDGKVVGDWGGCGTSPAEILKSGASVVFQPPPP